MDSSFLVGESLGIRGSMYFAKEVFRPVPRVLSGLRGGGVVELLKKVAMTPTFLSRYRFGARAVYARDARTGTVSKITYEEFDAIVRALSLAALKNLAFEVGKGSPDILNLLRRAEEALPGIKFCTHVALDGRIIGEAVDNALARRAALFVTIRGYGTIVDSRPARFLPLGEPVDSLFTFDRSPECDKERMSDFRDYLHDLFGRDESGFATIEFLQAWFGYCLTGSTRERLAVILSSDGGACAGKTTFMRLAAASIGSEAFRDARAEVVFGDRRSFIKLSEARAMRDARLVFVSERKYSDRLGTKFIDLVNGEVRCAKISSVPRLHKQKRGDSFPVCAKIMVEQRSPLFSVSGDRLYSRYLREVRFVARYGARCQDVEREIVSKHSDAFFAWAFEGLVRYIDTGLF